MKNKRGFTLVELLAVIVILAVILIIAIPQIMNTIKTTRLKSIEDSARLIATNADKDYLAQQAINSNYNATSIPCSDVAKLSKDYASCTITYNDSGVATVKLKGASGGKFSGVTCTGTKDNINCKQALPGYTDAVELLTSKIGTDGLIKDDHNELRYQGATVDNYVTFNDEEAGWRIVGLFNVDGEQRVKLVRKDSIGTFSWDSSDAEVNSGNGINQWGPSTYTNGTPYEGADLMRELNGDYLNSSLSENKEWYNGQNNKQEGVFNKDYVLKNSAQELIGEADWYTGGIPYAYQATMSLTNLYTIERGTQGKRCSSGNNCNDDVERTYIWKGKVGLVYASDYGYASSDANCKNDLSKTYCKSNNWLATGGSFWTISPWQISSYACITQIIHNYGNVEYSFSSSNANVYPSIYLISGVQMKGSGTTSDPYVFAE